MGRERLRFPKEMRVRKAARAAGNDFGLLLTYENYLLHCKNAHTNSLSVAISGRIPYHRTKPAVCSAESQPNSLPCIHCEVLHAGENAKAVENEYWG